jgi:molecular chaperone DnaJ
MQTQPTTKDYYAVLGVPAEADEEMVRKAFRSLARELHPDVNPGPGAEDRFRDVAEAYQVLSRPSRKRLYDRIGYYGRGNGGFASGSSDPLFEFWRMRRRRTTQTVEVELGHFEAARGTRRTVEVEARESCRECRGSGAVEGTESAVCAECAGSGRVKNVSASGTGRMLRVEPCPECLGSGRTVSAPCSGCSGVGDVWRRRQVEVHVPAGVANGEWIRLPDVARGADTYVRVNVLPPPRDSVWIRVGAFAALLVALAFFFFLLRR